MRIVVDILGFACGIMIIGSFHLMIITDRFCGIKTVFLPSFFLLLLLVCVFLVDRGNSVEIFGVSVAGVIITHICIYLINKSKS